MRKEENIMKKATALTLVLLMALALFAGCGAPAGNSASSSSAAQESQSAAKDSYTVAIAQYAQHGSLDNCRERLHRRLKQAGFEEGKNLTIEYKTPRQTAASIIRSHRPWPGQIRSDLRHRHPHGPGLL